MNKIGQPPEEIIQELINEMDQQRRIWDNLAAANNGFGPLSIDSCRVNEASCWIYGTANPVELAELEEWKLLRPRLLSTLSSSLARSALQCWSFDIRENESYLFYPEDELPKPARDESLHNYLLSLACDLQKYGWGSKSRRRAIKSFISSIRSQYKDRPKETAFIEQTFPSEMDLRDMEDMTNLYSKIIIRKIRIKHRPISIELAGTVIKVLADQFVHGRTNARKIAGEVLALCWMCLTASRIKMPTTLKLLLGSKLDAISFKDDRAYFSVPTIFGKRKVRVSVRLAEFIQSIGDLSPGSTSRKQIMQTNLYSLRRTLNSSLEAVLEPLMASLAQSEDEKDDLLDNLGKISFLSFLSLPHRAGMLIR